MNAAPQAQPEPDDKDWTWVLARACAECGFDAGAVPRAELAPLAAQIGARWDEVWAHRVDPGQRPAPTVWSMLEYTCHVRDVYALAVYRTTLMRDDDDPVFANWDQDVTAIESDYAGTDPEVVGPALSASARAYERLLVSVRDDEWQRPGRRSNGSTFTVESFTRYVLHDLAHHLSDVPGGRP